MQVVTKTALQPQVYEFVMDEAEYERRAMNNTAMFKDKIRLRNAGKKSEVLTVADTTGAVHDRSTTFDFFHSTIEGILLDPFASECFNLAPARTRECPS